jgi:hypothetical protein
MVTNIYKQRKSIKDLESISPELEKLFESILDVTEWEEKVLKTLREKNMY